jgi:hypothetical protein
MFLKKISQFFSSKNKLSFKVIKDIEEAKKWWEYFTPHQVIFDEWEFRYCFYKYFNYDLHFYLGFIKDEPIGLLPLQYDPERKYLEFFGGPPMDDNDVFIKTGYEKYVKNFFEKISSSAYLRYMAGRNQFSQKLPTGDYKYVLDITGFNDAYEYIEKTFNGETKKKLLKRIQKAQEHETDCLENNFQDIELLFELNLKNYKEESAFLKKNRQKIYRDLLHTSFKPCLLTGILDGQKASVSLGLQYHNQFISFNSGVKEDMEFDVYSYGRFQRINWAIKHRLTSFDALCGNYGWKEKWGFTKIPQYIFEKK